MTAGEALRRADPPTGASAGEATGSDALRLRDPSSGAALTADTPHSLTDGTRRWPVIDAIPYLRAGSEDRAAEALALLDSDRAVEATALLLAENDPWWDEAPPPHDRLVAVVRARDSLSLREAMAGLGWGRVGDYFAHRWSDPTYLAGLTILDRHWPSPDSAFEIACGIGHYLRALSKAGVAHVAGGDIVWGKLWVCRHWVCAEANLICFDAEAERWPADPVAELVTCHDAFYFLRSKPEVAARIREGARKLYAVPHIHNAEADTFSAAAATTADSLRTLFPEARLYDDAELTRAGAADDEPAPLGDTVSPEAYSLVGGPALRPIGADSRSTLLRPANGTVLTRNPLLTSDGVDWPSERYRDEYAPLATYGRSGPIPQAAVMSDEAAPFVRTRDLLDLPATW